jgi:hypothetical protein
VTDIEAVIGEVALVAELRRRLATGEFGPAQIRAGHQKPAFILFQPNE